MEVLLEQNRFVIDDLDERGEIASDFQIPGEKIFSNSIILFFKLYVPVVSRIDRVAPLSWDPVFVWYPSVISQVS